MSKICGILGISKSGYYKKLSTLTQRETFEQKVVSTVKEIRKDKSFYGLRKVYHEFCERSFDIGRDRLWRIMQKHGLMQQVKRNRYRTTIPGVAPKESYNLIKDLEINAPNQVWVTDITYLTTVEGIVYMSAIMDLASRKIIAWSISNDLKTQSSIVCLKKAIKSVKSSEGIIHHSDRGSQYCSYLYRSILEKNGIKPSFTGKNHCYENANIERFFNTIKHEYGLKGVIQSKALAKKLVGKTVEHYNNVRIHAALGYNVPASLYNAA